MVHLIAYISMFTSNEEIPKIEKAPLKTTTSFSSPSRTSHCLTNACIVFPNELIHRFFENKRVKCPGVAQPSPWAAVKLGNYCPTPGTDNMSMPCGCLRGERGWALLEFTNVACVAGVEGEGKGKKQRTKCVSVRKGDACKDAIVFFIPPSN